ncbi:MAG: DMT family transporter [Candidatus Wallbacteria bacterium]|nr:DMT family transporter [Candidatus Wallbacteria bacterium]
MKSPFFISAVIATGILAVSCASILVRACPEVPPLVISSYRLGLASIVVFSLALSRRRSIRMPSKTDFLLGILGGFFLSLHFTAWITSLNYTSVARSVVLVTTNPLFVGLLSWIVFGEKPALSLAVGIVLSLAGSAMLALSGPATQSSVNARSAMLFGDMLAVCGAVAASCYLLVGSRLRPRMATLEYICLVYGSCSLFLIGFTILSGLQFTGYSQKTYFLLAVMALIPQLIGHTAFNWSLRYLSAGMVSLTILGEPLGASVMAYFILGESVTLPQFAGMGLILSGIIIGSASGWKPAYQAAGNGKDPSCQNPLPIRNGTAGE